MPESEWVRLIQAVAQGDQKALHAIYEKTHRIVFTLMMRIAKDQIPAEDLTVEVFHDVWLKASKFAPAREPSVLAWIMNLARAKAIERLRSDQQNWGTQRALAKDVAAQFLRKAADILDPDE